MHKLFWIRVEEEGKGDNYGYIERIELANGEIIRYDTQEDKIDLMALEPYIGEEIEYYRNGELYAVRTIDNVGPDEERNGIITLWFKLEDEDESSTDDMDEV